VEHGTALNLHIGVNTGPVVTGAVGSRDRKDYSVMGDAVNLAARLEDASTDGEIYVGPNTYRLSNALFDFEPLPKLVLKGKSESLDCFRLVGLKAKPGSARGIEGLHSELVGRGRELEQLQEAIRDLRAGNGGICAVVGEAGIGKSRLIHEALAAFGPDLFCAEGRALSHTTGMSYWMARDVVRALLNSSGDVSVGELNEALIGKLQALGPAIFEPSYPYLATLLQLPLNENTLEQTRFLSSEALQGRILRAVNQFVAESARREPIIIFWEDLHWCDPSSLLVLEHLLPLVTRLPLLILLAYRPEEATSEALQKKADELAGHRCRSVLLPPLDREQSDSLVERLLKIENLPPSIRALIVDRADGNPFFIEELLRTLLDSGAVVVQDGRIIATREIDSLRVPETVEGVLAARMDRLAPDQKNTLQSAAVIGRSFQRKVLLWMASSGSERSLDKQLVELERRDFIELAGNRDGTNREYAFKHAITQDVAYNALLRARRREIHQRVGEALEALFPDRLRELSAALGYHFERADAPEKAFRYLRQAGEHAQSIFANSEAADFYRSAINQAGVILEKRTDAETTSILAQVHESLGDVYHLAGKDDQARASYGAAIALASGHDRVTRSRLQRKIGSCYTLARRYASMAEAYEAANKELGDQPIAPVERWWGEKMQILLDQMHLFYWQGRSDEMMQLADIYKNDIEEKGMPGQRGKFYQMLGLSLLTGARYVSSDETVRLCELAVSTSRGSNDLADMAHIRFTAGLAHLFRGNLREAIEHFRAALSLAERVGDLVVQARCLSYLTVAYRRFGDLNETRQSADRTMALAGQLGMVEYLAMAKANLAWLAWREGRGRDASLLGQEALALWHGMEDPYGVDWQALLPLIAIATTDGRFDSAIEYTRGLFGENQHPLPSSLTAVAEEAINTWGKTGATDVRSKLEQLIAVAKQIDYL
jgi:tetratricopeptide (TPR) repeat protein